MDNDVREARHHGLTEGDPGDEQPVETPEWLKDNHPVCLFEKDGIRCILPVGHESRHAYPNMPFFCYRPETCWGRTSCPGRPACSE